MRVELAATIEVRGSFEAEPDSWPEHFAPLQVVAAFVSMYQEDPVALLEALGSDAVTVEGRAL